jgi:hypothetical protein
MPRKRYRGHSQAPEQQQQQRSITQYAHGSEIPEFGEGVEVSARERAKDDGESEVGERVAEPP